MERRVLICKGLWTAAVVLTTTAGCQHVGTPSMIPGVSAGFDDSSGKLKPKQAADVQIALARSLEMHGEIEKALAMYEDAVKKDPSRGDAWLRLAILHDQQGQFAQSADLYQKALKAQPGSAEVFCDMGYSLYLQGRWSEAEMNLRQALALRPEHSRAHNNLGLLLARAGKEEEALDEFHKAGCRDADAQVNLAFALTLENHVPEARLHYQLALQADPASVAAKKGLQELEQVVARMDSATGANRTQASDAPVAPAQWSASSEPRQ
jgi:Tfp pilus assembly protein PilF